MRVGVLGLMRGSVLTLGLQNSEVTDNNLAGILFSQRIFNLMQDSVVTVGLEFQDIPQGYKWF